MLNSFDMAEALHMKPAPMDVASDEFAEFALDQVEEFDEIDDREVVHVILQEQEFHAVVLGFGSSYPVTENGKPAHTHNPSGPPLKGVPCTFCRWADVTIMRMVADTDTDDDNLPMYVLATVGQTVVQGETPRVSTVWSADPFEILKGLYINGRASDGRDRERKIPFPNAVAFRRAAMVDNGIERVLEAHDEAIPDPSQTGFRL